MSVFKRNKQLRPMISPENHAKFPCSENHTINMVVPTIDASIMEIQHPEWIGRACDCGKITYNEGKCYCPNNSHWEIHWKPNPNY